MYVEQDWGTKTITERFVVVANKKSASPTWIDVRAALLTFDRAGLRGLLQDLYAASKDNRAFLHSRLGLGDDQLKPYKANISRWISPDLMRNHPISISKAKKAIADYKNAIGRPEGWQSCRFSIARRRSTSSTLVACKTRATFLL